MAAIQRAQDAKKLKPKIKPESSLLPGNAHTVDDDEGIAISNAHNVSVGNI